MGNSFFNEYPYTDFHELNLSWVIKELRSFATTLEQFVSINALKYADPIQWNITTQYEKNTIVIDPQTGTAYISVAPVPAGVALTNPDYWTIVFDLGSFVVRASKNFATVYEAETTTSATVNIPAGTWLVWGDTLYKANVNITAGDTYVPDANITHFTIEDVIGHLNDLNTTDKSNLVSAINDVITTLASTTGDLNDLTTTDKTNLVSAINEVLTALTSTTGDLNDLTTTDKSSLVNAINEVNQTGGGAVSMIGDLNDLTTTDKTNVVAAINELDAKFALIEPVNVKDHGAKGDGITDDTAAIQYCLDNFDGVYFPDGDYLVSSTLVANKARWILGQTYTSSVILRADTMTGDTLQIGDDNTSAGSFIIEKLFFKRNYDQATGGAIVLDSQTAHVRIKHGQLFRISDCLMWYCPSNLVLHACTVGVVERCNINGCTFIRNEIGGGLQEGFCNINIMDMPTATNGVGQLIHIKDCLLAGGGTRLAYNRTISGVTVNNYWGTGCQHGIICSESEGLVVSGNYIGANSYNGITCNYLNTTGSQIMNCLRIHDNFFDPAYQYQIQLNGVAQVVIHGNTFNGQGMAYQHIWLNDVKGIAIAGNLLQYTYGCMLFATGATKGLTVAGNTFIDFCKLDTNHATFFDEAIYADQTVDGCVVGNSFSSFAETCYASRAVTLGGTTPQIFVGSNRILSTLTETNSYIGNVGDVRYIGGALKYWDGTAWTAT